MANNRKATKGRRIQAINVPAYKYVLDEHGYVRVKNKHRNAGKTIQVRHLS
jgi:hypothetical protein